MAQRPPESRIAERRWQKEVRRRRLLKDRRRLAFFTGDEGRPYRSPILDLFHSVDLGDGSGTRRVGVREFLAPKIFSLSRNPSGFIKFLREIVGYARSARRPRIVLDQRNIAYLGLGADSVLGVVLSEIKQELRYVVGSYIRGFKPKSKEIQKIMDEVGSVRALFMETERDIRLSFSSRAKVFRHRHRPSDEGEATPLFDPSAMVVADFSDHLDQSLALIGRKLSVEGRDGLCHYAAEVLDNVKEHSGLGEWAIVGYADPDSKNPTYRCAIFCFGKTIAQTFQELPEDAYPRRLIEPYIRAHRGGALFASDWREEDLITLIALQGDVSSKSVDDTSDRGQGTVELIEFFQSVSVECGIRQLPAEMNIISGSTRIRFDGKYSMTFREDLNRHIVAFNEVNDLSVRPDRKYVVAMGESYFPGTLITVEIPLTSTFLDHVEDSDED